MIVRHRSTSLNPGDRGHELGKAHAERIGRTLGFYRQLVTADAPEPVNLDAFGLEALAAIAGWTPELASEIEGIAAGAGVPVQDIAALNARTELLAACRVANGRGECSVAVVLGDYGAPPLAVQTWDWHDELEDSWFVWTIEHPDGRTVHTLTEYGIVGKIGLSSVGLGAMLNILRHREDRAAVGVPIHVIARRVLDEADDLDEALRLIASARTSASSALTLVAAKDGEKTALTAELHPGGPAFVLPDTNGLLVHTNHFLGPRSAGDLEPVLGPDSLLRMEVLRRRLSQRRPRDIEQLRAEFNSHLGGAGAICCHPAPSAERGMRYATLATLELEVADRRMTVRRGGPCSDAHDRWSTDQPQEASRA